MARTRSEKASTADRGITVVFFAIGLTALLTVGALVLGGSVGYSAARDAQTAADAAALAGASMLQNHKQDWITVEASDVSTEIKDVVESNGSALERCDLIFTSYALYGGDEHVSAPCDELAKLDKDDFENVAGVRVTVTQTRDVAFSSFVDQDQVSVRATAAATIQPVATGRAPFMVCALAEGHPKKVLIEDPEDETQYVVNPAAYGLEFVLWGNHIKYGGRDCGNGASQWRGLMKYDQFFDINGWWSVESGNSIGVDITFEPMVVGDDVCELNEGDLFELEQQRPCLIALPLCVEGRSVGSTFEVRCVKMGLFELSRVGTIDGLVDTVVEYATPCTEAPKNIICGRLVEAEATAIGRGFAAPADGHELSVVKLVE